MMCLFLLYDVEKIGDQTRQTKTTVKRRTKYFPVCFLADAPVSKSFLFPSRAAEPRPNHTHLYSFQSMFLYFYCMDYLSSSHLALHHPAPTTHTATRQPPRSLPSLSTRWPFRPANHYSIPFSLHHHS